MLVHGFWALPMWNIHTFWQCWNGLTLVLPYSLIYSVASNVMRLNILLLNLVYINIIKLSRLYVFKDNPLCFLPIYLFFDNLGNYLKQVKIICFNILFINLYMYEFFVYMYVHLVCAVPEEARRGYIPWN